VGLDEIALKKGHRDACGDRHGAPPRWPSQRAGGIGGSEEGDRQAVFTRDSGPVKEDHPDGVQRSVRWIYQCRERGTTGGDRRGRSATVAKKYRECADTLRKQETPAAQAGVGSTSV